jgi:hypothetical protein
MNYVIIGSRGSDAGYTVLTPHGLKHVGGWGVDALADVSRALTILGESVRLKTPGLANSVTKSVHDFVEKELSAHLGEQLKDGGGVVIINVNAG